MSTAVAQSQAAVVADPRMAAFVSPECPEVFHAVANPNWIWKADPYDVETIHSEAREVFEHLLTRAGRAPLPPSGAVLVLARRGRQRQDAPDAGLSHARPWAGAGVLRLPANDGRGEQLCRATC